MVVTAESYDFNYQIFLAEQDLFDDMMGLSSGYLAESIGLISLQEGFKETISKYITKITTALENAWNRFKGIITRKKDQTFLQSIDKKVEAAKPDFTIDNFKEFDTTVVENTKIIPFNYEQMKDDLETKEKFCKKYYPNLIKDPNKSFKQNIVDSAVKGVKNGVKCTGEMLVKMKNFLVKELPNKMKVLESDLKAISSSNKKITDISNATDVKQESISFYHYYITEEENTKTNNPQFKDVENGPGGGNNGSFVKSVTTYVGICVDIITAKMLVLKNQFLHYMKILMHFFTPKSLKKENEKQTVPNTSETKTTINT